jgi:Transglutaminase-like superfamily/Coenzyme PQQ synthesis protein D (PqqD)
MGVSLPVDAARAEVGAERPAERGFVPVPSIRQVEVEGLRVLLDLRTESYRILDDSASRLWPALTGERDTAEAYAAAAAEFDVEEGRWRADLAAFARRCVQEGLLESAGSASVTVPVRGRPPRARSAHPTTVHALSCLLGTRRALRRQGFGATYESYAGIGVVSKHEQLAPALSTFTRAENMFVPDRAPGDCLLRSLALYRFLRSIGCQAEHVMGVRRFPFRAHAWVECDGAAVLDDRFHSFTPIARIGCETSAYR